MLGLHFLVVNISIFVGRKEKCYKFINEEDGSNCSRLPDLPAGPPTPPPPLPAGPAGPDPPPPPPSPPPPEAGADHQVQDMDLEEEPAGNITDQLSMFYSEIEGAPPKDEEKEEEESTTSSASSPRQSPPESPAQLAGRKRKKVLRLSSNSDAVRQFMLTLNRSQLIFK